MKTLNNVEEYSEIYDNIMNAELEVVQGAYRGEWGEYSIKIPNSITKMELVSFADGDQPKYRMPKFPEYLEEDTQIADYPRHGSTLRIFYKDLEKAISALYFLDWS